MGVCHVESNSIREKRGGPDGGRMVCVLEVFVHHSRGCWLAGPTIISQPGKAHHHHRHRHRRRFRGRGRGRYLSASAAAVSRRRSGSAFSRGEATFAFRLRHHRLYYCRHAHLRRRYHDGGAPFAAAAAVLSAVPSPSPSGRSRALNPSPSPSPSPTSPSPTTIRQTRTRRLRGGRGICNILFSFC